MACWLAVRNAAATPLRRAVLMPCRVAASLDAAPVRPRRRTLHLLAPAAAGLPPRCRAAERQSRCLHVAPARCSAGVAEASGEAAGAGEGGPARRLRVLSGVQPTGSIHLGNYLGAIRNWVALQESYETFYCVVDLHAITAPHDPKLLADSTRTVAALYLASGVEPERSCVFVQSHVAAHSELAWLLNCCTPIGWLNKMIQFKEKARKQGDDNVSVGLMDYPVLMAADILLYGADLVPVGEDQRQHLELTRDIAGRVNSLYGGKAWAKRKGTAPGSGKPRGGRVLKVPEALIAAQGARVMSLDDGTSKMSKSNPDEGSRIGLLDSPDVIAAKVKRCKTDTGEGLVFDDPSRPEAANLLTIYQLCRGATREAVAAECGTMRWSQFKPLLTEAVVEHLRPLQEKYKHLTTDTAYLDTILTQGADTASEVAQRTLDDVRDALGYMPRPKPRH